MHGMRTLLFRVFVLAFWRSRSWEFEPGHPRRDGDLHDHRDDLREAVLHFLFFFTRHRLQLRCWGSAVREALWGPVFQRLTTTRANGLTLPLKIPIDKSQAVVLHCAVVLICMP